MKHLFLTSSIGTPGIAESIRAKLNGDKPLKTAFITTAVETKDEQKYLLPWYDVDRNALRAAGFDFFDYTITGKSENDIKKDLSAIEVLFVCGGNEFYLKQQSNKCNFESFVKDFVAKGKPYIGCSSGSMIMGPEVSPARNILETSELDDPQNFDTTGFGIVDFLVLPHWGSEDFREPYMKGKFEYIYNENNKLVLINDFEYVEVLGEQFRIIDLPRGKAGARNEK